MKSCLCIAMVLCCAAAAGVSAAEVHLHSRVESAISLTEIEQVQKTIHTLTTKLESLLHISPELDPTSDKKFFKQDYPNDKRPATGAKWDHPYPTVQDSEDYDKDYVKDENNDGGEWKAQENYDRLVNQFQKDKDNIKKALEKEHHEEEDVQAAKEREIVAAEKAKKEQEKADEARKKAADAKKAAEAAGKKAEDADSVEEDGAAGDAKSVQDGVGNVEKEAKELAACKEQLVKARGELEELLKKKAARDAEKVATEVDDEFATEEEKKKEQVEEDLEAKLAQNEKEHDGALKSYEEEKAEVEKTDADLQKAAANLRKWRKDVDADGGIYRSAATSRWSWSVERISFSVAAAFLGPAVF